MSMYCDMYILTSKISCSNITRKNVHFMYREWPTRNLLTKSDMAYGKN